MKKAHQRAAEQSALSSPKAAEMALIFFFYPTQGGLACPSLAKVQPYNLLALKKKGGRAALPYSGIHGERKIDRWNGKWGRRGGGSQMYTCTTRLTEKTISPAVSVMEI